MSFDFNDLFDGVGEIFNEFKEFYGDMEEVGEGIKGAFVELGSDLKNCTREFEVEAAYEIDPDLGKLMEKKQKVEDTVENIIKSPHNLTLVGKKRKDGYKLADHLFVRRGVYTHHAIYVGDGRVIHYSSAYGDITDVDIHIADLEEFADGNQIYYLGRDKSPLIYSPEEAVKRAWSRVGEENYNLFGNNCEQFVRWCRCGRTK